MTTSAYARTAISRALVQRGIYKFKFSAVYFSISPEIHTIRQAWITNDVLGYQVIYRHLVNEYKIKLPKGKFSNTRDIRFRDIFIYEYRDGKLIDLTEEEKLITALLDND